MPSTKVRYWYHPESDCLFESEYDEAANSNGLVEEVTLEEYQQLKRQQEEADADRMKGSSMVNKRVGNLRRDNDRGGGSKGGFNYRPPTADHVKRQAERKGGKFDSIFKGNYDTFTPKEGDNVVRILPPSWEGAEDWAFKVWVHFGIGADESSYLCLRKMDKGECPICQEVARMKADGDTEDAKRIDCKERFVCWIVDRNDRDEGATLYSMPATTYKDINALCYSPRTGKAIFIDNPDDGYDVTIRRQGVKRNTRYLPSIDRDPSPLTDDNRTYDELAKFIEDNPIDECLQYFDVDYLEKALSGQIDSSNKDRDQDDDRSARRGRGGDDDERPRRNSRRDEPEADERPRRNSRRDEPEPEADERPRRGGRSARDDDPPFDDPIPASLGGRDRDAESDNEADEARSSRRSRRDEPADDEPAPRRSRREPEPEPEADERPRRTSRRDEPEPEPEERPRRSRRDPEPEDERPTRRSREPEPEPEADERPARRSRRDEPADDEPAPRRSRRD